MHTLVCPKCGHQDTSPTPLSEAVFRCSECEARIAYGEIMPRVALVPSADGRWFTLRFENGPTISEHKIDRGLLASLTTNALSVLQ